jgi:hypothetical protein
MNSFRGPTLAIGRFLRESRAGRLLTVFLSVALLPPLYWLTPMLSRTAAVTAAAAKMDEFRRFEAVPSLPPGVERMMAVVSLNPLLNVEIIASQEKLATRPASLASPPERAELWPSMRIKYDNLILYIGITLITGLVLWTSMRPRASVPNAASSVSLGIPVVPLEEKPDRTPRTITAEEFLSDQVQTAAAIANTLYDRSTLLLSGEIIMAFIGVGVFYVTVPDMTGVGTLTGYIPHVVRPAGMLLFVEAIAWFLLRQYRVQIEDYKGFYRMYLRRANLLIALKTILSAPKDRAQRALAEAFLQDDQSGRLRKDETTEALATLAASDPNAVFDLFKHLMSQGGPPKQRDGKGTTET